MKPEHTKEFNAVHAKAGAPYCQRNGLAARIGIWDADHYYFKLIGVATSLPSGESACTWQVDGRRYDATDNSSDLVMLPLDYCEGKPVFVGDELMTRDRGLITVTPMFILADECKWPRTAPVMPKARHPRIFSCLSSQFDFNAVVGYAITEQRQEIEAYWKALDEFNGVGK